MANKKQIKNRGAETDKYELTEQERRAVAKYLERRKTKTLPRLKVSDKGDGHTVAIDHPVKAVGVPLLTEALGGVDQDFLIGILSQLADSQGQEVSERDLNFMLSVVIGVEPKDQIEAMLATQMAAVHAATMTFARRLADVENIPQQDSAERAFNKLARTFASQMEALKRYRTGGEQKMTVQHVTVSEGGQAIVGNVTQTSAAKPSEKTASSQPVLTDAKTEPMPIINQNKESAVVPTRRRPNK